MSRPRPSVRQDSPTRIDYSTKSVHAAYCALEFREIGQTSSDPMVREAVATYSGQGFDRPTGISGAPFWDETTAKLRGMAMHGGLEGHIIVPVHTPEAGVSGRHQ